MKRVPLLCLALLLCIQPAYAQRVDQLPSLHQNKALPHHKKTSRSKTTSPAVAPLQNPITPHALDAKVAAVVNDGAISTYDIEARTRLSILSAGLPDSAEIRHHLTPQILRSLIEEQLQMQEARRLEITIPDEDINKALDRIAADNHIPGGDMRAFLRARGASPESLAAQIRANLAWTKVIQRELRPRIDIGDDEVDAIIERIRANAGKEEYAVSEIFLAVDSPQEEEQVKQLAENLSQQIRDGANFSAVAHQFSQSASGASGGDIGWVQEGQLPPDISHAITSLEPSQISTPLRSASGYYILSLREKRTISLGSSSDVTFNLQQVFSSNATEDEANGLRNNLVGCKDLQSKITQNYPTWRWQNMGYVKLSKAPSWIADTIRDIGVGKSSDPISTDKGVVVIFVCSRTTGDDKINREALVNAIGTEKLELQARRLIRDLHHAAYIEVHKDALPQ